ncbi:GNAT family N-acetyltransferase [Sneathiella glossodoripedis]|uniref:GNAT family N-acetyltransferase n=1 Tax=Sneathiella glossodoripedis TaxID=418853 RepID=UPI00046F1C0E|nr:GNAT family N-acetyltransferase [Sneathiella glossodoripedis]
MSSSYSIRTLQQINELPAIEWNKCQADDHPFTSFEFLNALEESGSVSAQTGWMPQHLVLEDEKQNVLAVAPMYIKGHSQGEYVFDHSWAHAYERAGGRYYPKLQMSVPFSPVTGPRLLVSQAEDYDEHSQMLLNGAKQVAIKYGISSVHLTFLRENDLANTEATGFLTRVGEQFHWHNRSYQQFDDFLEELSSRKRKAIKKERRLENFEGLVFETLQGDEITASHWDAFFEFYMDTGHRKWGTPYLNREFFDLLGSALREKVILFMVKRDEKYIAGALNLMSSNCLYGRYWGCVEEHKFLHFECCYYRAIEFAIENGLERVEAGAQGPHKLARGYLPTKTYSAHWMQDPGFHDAVGDFLKAESRDMDAEIEYLGQLSPFRRGPVSGQK